MKHILEESYGLDTGGTINRPSRLEFMMSE